MITKDEIQELLHSTETYRVERTVSTGDMDKFQEAICAFANDMPNSRKNGYKADVKLSLASRTIQRDIAILTKLGRVVREGGRYDGTWRVITKPKELTHEI